MPIHHRQQQLEHIYIYILQIHDNALPHSADSICSLRGVYNTQYQTRTNTTYTTQIYPSTNIIHTRITSFGSDLEILNQMEQSLIHLQNFSLLLIW